MTAPHAAALRTLAGGATPRAISSRNTLGCGGGDGAMRRGGGGASPSRPTRAQGGLRLTDGTLSSYGGGSWGTLARVRTSGVRRSSSRSRTATTLAAMPSSAVDNALAYGSSTYVPSPMDYGALQSQLVVLGVVGIMTAYWWYVLVPGARVNLAVNKKSGKLRDYLEDLKEDDDRKLERFFYQKWLAKVDPETRYLLRDDPDSAAGGGGEEAAAATAAAARKTSLADTEGGVTRDVGQESLQDIIRKAKKAPKFWSGDNPVLIGTAVSIGAAALFGVIDH
mmetsp:Transcript_38731/g.96138  ORF Transcript_38731/g.96138 Transcript_38731/m.96138 type:complete len:280 (-) Transcript_38731:118-957(-)